MGRKKQKPYRIVGAYDSETTTINDDTGVYAFPVTHQLGKLSCHIDEITPDNVRDKCEVNIYRHAIELYGALDDIVASANGYVPVICCHNLAFDMYGLAPYLDSHEVKVLAKSQRKPITFTILDEAGKPALVIWDTLVFSQQPLARMGENAGYRKAVGNWDYSLIRTPDTPLSEPETIYAKDDIYALLTWVSWWLSKNPEIEPSKLGLNVVTKTGVVRERRKLRFASLKKGKNSVGRSWYFINRTEAPKSDDELFTMQAATRGGFTFCASKFASVPFMFDDDRRVVGYDATSQHPAQMVSHRYPVKFHETTPKALDSFLRVVQRLDYKHVLNKWSKPFPKAIYAAYEFEGIRPKAGALFEEWGIYPLASARFSKQDYELDEDNGDALNHENNRRNIGYADKSIGARYEFGKLVSADKCVVYVTELALWEICQCYEWDSARGIHGYMTGRFVRPSDMAVISVMQFYQAKNLFKDARKEYFDKGRVNNVIPLVHAGIPEAIAHDMQQGNLSATDIDAVYLGLKSDLNSLFGVEASNEYRRDTILTSNGIEYEGEYGICNAPKNPKAWYQFGQRIVGWSRIAQICVMQLVRPYVKGIINGDTDSLKLLCTLGDIPYIDRELGRLARAIDRGKVDNCARVKASFPSQYDKLEGIGHYVKEFEATHFCAAWNKAYVEKDAKGYHFTLAGLPTKDVYRKNDDGELELFGQRLDGFAQSLEDSGMKFDEVANLLLGYNVTYAHDLTGLNARKFPEWGELVYRRITDYLGNESQVAEPAALALYPMAKTVGSFAFSENRINANIALSNNDRVNIETVIVSREGVNYVL